MTRTDDRSKLVTQEVIAKITLQPQAFKKDTLISPGYSFALEHGISRYEATLDELREVLSSETNERSKP